MERQLPPLRVGSYHGVMGLNRIINALGRRMPHKARRFVLDRMGFGALFQAVSKGQTAKARLGKIVITYNPLLHGSIVRHGEVIYEPHVAEAVRANLGPGRVFYDIGANVGIFAAIAESRGATAIAFEPEENNLIYLRQNVANVCGFAIGKADGRSVFHPHGGAFSGRLADGVTAASSTVEVRSVDSLVAEGWPVPDLIKIDVEGAEGDVLEGAAATLRRHRPTVLCEMHDFSEGPERARRALDAAGYWIEPLGEQHVLARPR